MRFRIIKNAWFITTGGMVIWPFILLKKTRSGPYTYTQQQVFKHELQHVYQIKEMGVAKFYWSYLVLLLKHGYKNHPYEIEAVKQNLTPLTQTEEVWFTQNKVGL